MYERAFGIVAAFTGVYAVYHGFGFSSEMGVLASAGALPVLAGFLLVGLGARLAFEKAGTGSTHDVDVRRLSTCVILLVAYLYLLPRVGFLGVTPVFLAGLSLLLGKGTLRDRAVTGVSLAAVVTLCIFVMFTKGFRLMLP